MRSNHLTFSNVSPREVQGSLEKKGRYVLFSFVFPVFAQKCKVIYEQDSRTHGTGGKKILSPSTRKKLSVNFPKTEKVQVEISSLPGLVLC